MVIERDPMDRIASARIELGGAFILDTAHSTPAVWGQDDLIAWAAGEALMLAGGIGIGKTTLAGELVRGLIQDEPSQVLGMPLVPSERPVLYVAADRPRQIGRAFSRLFADEDRTQLDSQLIFHRGPLPFDLAVEPTALVDFTLALGVGVVVLDSLKDVAADLSKDETGNRVNTAIQHVVAEGIEVLALHHQRKGDGTARAAALGEVYGSTWLTAGMGSVLFLSGEPGSPIARLDHLKPPVTQLNPMELEIDHAGGRVRILEQADAFTVLRAAPNGLSAKEAAQAMFGKDDKAHEVRARRQLDRLRDRGKAFRREGGQGRGAVREAARYFLAAAEGVQEEIA